MARKLPKCPPIVEPNHFGSMWKFGDQKVLSDESHGSKSLPGAGNERSLVPMLTFDEQLRIINIKSKKRSANVIRSLKKNEVWKNTMEKSFWKKIKSRYENANKRDRIVVLKPIDRVLECPVDIGCRCFHSHSHQISTSKQKMVKHTHVSFNDVRNKLKNSKVLKKGLRKLKSFNETSSKTETLSLVSYSKRHEPDVFMEARRHLADRLRLVAMGEGAGEPLGSACKQKVSRTLERILLSSPIHEPMAAFEREPERSHGFVEVTDSYEFLNLGSMLSNMGSEPNNDGPSPSGTDGSIEGPQLEILLDVRSPKARCKLENMDNGQFRDNPSPVSVLDLLLSEYISSPTSTIESVEHQIQPRRIDFEEQLSQTSSPHRETSLSLFGVDQGLISLYVKEIYQTAQSNWEDFLVTDYPLESSCDHKVIYDYVKEMLISLHSRKTLFSSRVQPFSLEKDVTSKVIDQVEWHNGHPVGPPRTLDHLVRRDIAKGEPWLDTLLDKSDIAVEVADDVLQDLVIEVIYDIYF